MTWLPRLALAITLALVVVLSMRLVASNDLGYHLADGETFLDTGRPVDTNEFIYTNPDRPTEDRALEFPACWYDGQGRYRFPNTNWLSQVVMAAVWRIAGPVALSLLLVALVAGVFLFTLATMRQAGVSTSGSAAGLLFAALIAQERFTLRPEIFGYLIVSAQLWLLLPVMRGTTAPSWRRVASLVVLQGLLINFHSYFLIGLGLTGAALADRLIRVWWPGREGTRTHPGRLAALLALQVIVCFANPWGWRLVWMPFQTVSYMRRFGVMNLADAGERHPWANISELASPFSQRADLSVFALFGLAFVAAGLSLRGRNWGQFLVVVGMAAIGSSFRRNLAVAALLITPVALAALRDLVTDLAPRKRAAPRAAFDLSVAVIALVVIVLVVTQRFNYPSDSVNRFGLGMSRMNVPLGSAAWINDHVPDEIDRLWTNFNSSSNLHFFTEPHREVPLLTNIWAMPPGVMREVSRVNRGTTPFNEIVERFGLKVVALEVDAPTEPLAVRLAWDPGWALVYLDAVHTVFLRIERETADLVTRFAITPSSLDVEAHGRMLRAIDPVPSYGLFHGANTLARLGALDPAIILLREVVTERPGHEQAWTVLGTALGQRGSRRLQRGESGAQDDVREARDSFRRALEIDPEDERARENLDIAERQLASFGE